MAILLQLIDAEGKRFSYVVYPGTGHSLQVDYWSDLVRWFDVTVR